MGSRRARPAGFVGNLIVAILVAASTTVALGDDPQLLTLPTSSAAAVSPMQDDAGLRDVEFVGTQIGWAVGDHGVIWNTDDGGQNWQLVPAPVDYTLRSVCFLTDRVGWIAGGGTIPHTRQGFGVVIATSDGGATWQQLGGDTLPPLCYVRFFDKQHGVVVGEASAEHPTGVLTTEDGGKTWQPIAGKQHAGWRTADFVASDLGIVAGLRGQTSLVGERKLMPTRLQTSGLRGMHAVKLLPNGKGWLVGDGGLVMSTDSGGLVWQEPPTPLELNDIFDFRALAARGDSAWIAGSPGSIVWHTPDGGRSWQQQPTGQSVPISALDFSDDSHGWAVGELGTVLKTDDGGRTWTAVRGQGRRVALMAMSPRAQRVSFHLIARESAENGYRSLTFLPARHDVGPDGANDQDQDLRLHDAVLAAGGATGIVGWQLPVAAPDIEHNKQLLIDDWKRRTDNDLSETMLGSLVCRLRTWRPNVVVLDRPADDDAVGILLNEAMLKAVEQAADETRFVSHRQLAGLSPWQVDKVFVRMPEKSQGDTQVDPHEYLPRLGRAVHEVAAPAQSRLTSLPRQLVAADAYQLVFRCTNLPDADVAKRDFFSGLSLQPGCEARRMLAPLDDRDDEARRKLAQKQRNFQAYAEQFLDDPRHAAQLIAQLSYVTQGMSSEQGATQLAQLADDYRQRSDWDLYEATLVELVERYSDEPIALDAMRRLLQMWSGAEPVWQRARTVGVSQKKLTLDTDALAKRVDKAIESSRSGTAAQFAAELELGPDPLTLLDRPGSLKIDADKDLQSGAAFRWNQQALRIATLIRQKSPRFYRSPEVQFSVAALMRSRGGHRLADEFYHRWLQNGEGAGWNAAAAAELWLATPHGASPKKMSICRRTAGPPYLDGVLSDDCWQQADEIALTSAKDGAAADAPPALAMVSYDSRFFYFAVSVPRDRRAPDTMPILDGRTHDADLTGFDRVGLYLDLDRDYATHYALAVDQRGWTAESCCDDLAWNPQWHVAARGDEGHWRVEAAIPLEELAPSAPMKNDVWAVGIVRTIPAVGLQSWTQPASTSPRPETFGLIRFD
ncbi:MAG: YCF48-related protein [Planctomycetaceae bacterium]